MDKIFYYDIHTHRLPDGFSEGVECYYNWIVGDKPISLDVGDHQLCSCGIHPWFINENNWKEQLARLKEMASHKSVVLIGEAGLDRLSKASFPLQMNLFEEQVRLSEALQKPLLIHCVKSWNELIAFRNRMRPRMKWIIHGFRKGPVLAGQLLKAGFYLSFGESFQSDALRMAWEDHRLFLETDESRLPIETIYERAAYVLNVPVPLLAAQVQKNLSSVWT